MSDLKKCPQCGGELPANFPAGACPICLLQQGLSPSTFMSGMGSGGVNSSTGRRRSWTPPTPAELAPRFPQLEIVELLGQGGMGAVYKVRQRDLDRWAALKVLPDDVAHDPNFAERFQREARALALLGHQHIVIVYEFGQRDGVYFLLMEFIDGVTLRQAIRAGQISTKAALSIVAQICDALQFAHEEGVVHRDIKPENILIDRRGRVKIADFGLAKLLGRAFEVPTLTGTHQVMGTPMYMAPEQMEGTRGVDHRADIFSLGVVFYELLTGELPLGRFAPPSQKYQLDARLDDVVLRTLEKEPDRRYQRASDVKCDVESIGSQSQADVPMSRLKQNQLHVAASPDQTKPAKQKRRWFTLKRIAIAVTSLVAVYWMCMTVVFFQEMHDAQAVNTFLRQANQQLEWRLASKNSQQERQPAIGDQTSENTDAIVQFTPQGPKLSRWFGVSELNAEQRVLVSQILAKIHKDYLAIESQHTKSETKPDGTQTSVIEKFNDEAALLVNQFWTEIDSQLPVEQQRFLRKSLPLFADLHQSAVPTIPGMQAGSRGAAIGSAGPIEPEPSRQNGTDSQLLGWNQSLLPVQIEISRRGKWFRWSILRLIEPSHSHPAGSWIEREITASGEDPKLPSGLRRFWRENEQTQPVPKTLWQPDSSDNDLSPGQVTSQNAPTSFLNPDFSEILAAERSRETASDPLAKTPIEASAPTQNVQSSISRNEIIQFTKDGLTLHRDFGAKELTAEQRQILEQILTSIHQQYLALEESHSTREIKRDGTQLITIGDFREELSNLDDEIWRQIDSKFPEESIQKYLRDNLPLRTIAQFDTEQIIGPMGHQQNEVEIRRRGKWYRWEFPKFSMKGEVPELPPGLRRFWRQEKAEVPNQTEPKPEEIPVGPPS